MKDRGKGPPPPLSELNRRPSEQGIQITVQHLERHRTAGQDTLDLRNGASKFLIQSAIQTAPSYYLTRHEHDSVITCRTTGTPRAGMLSWSSGGQRKKRRKGPRPRFQSEALPIMLCCAYMAPPHRTSTLHRHKDNGKEASIFVLFSSQKILYSTCHIEFSDTCMEY